VARQLLHAFALLRIGHTQTHPNVVRRVAQSKHIGGISASQRNYRISAEGLSALASLTGEGCVPPWPCPLALAGMNDLNPFGVGGIVAGADHADAMAQSEQALRETNGVALSTAVGFIEVLSDDRYVHVWPGVLDRESCRLAVNPVGLESSIISLRAVEVASPRRVQKKIALFSPPRPGRNITHRNALRE